MDAPFIAALVDIVERSQLTELEYRYEGHRIRLARTQPNSAVPQAHTATPAGTQTEPPTAPRTSAIATPVDHGGHTIQAGLHGVFYTSPAPDEAAFVQVGDTVSEGQTVALIEAMKMLHAIEAPHAGVITQILVDNGMLVSPETALFVVKRG